MTNSTEAYEVEEGEFSEDFETFDEARRRPTRRVSVPGAGLTSAVLNTPRGPARLSLPAALPTLTQFRALEQALNAQGQRINTLTAELLRVRRELAIRRREQQGLGSSSFIFPLMMMKRLRDDLEGHTHSGTGTVVLPASTGGGFSALLPLLLLMPGMFGTSSASASSSGGGMDNMQPLLLAFVFSELF